MNNRIDSYLNEVIGLGDEGSSLLAKITTSTLKNCKYVDIVKEGMNGVAVLKNLPKDYDVVVYSIGADPKISDINEYTRSLVNNLVDISKYNNLIPLAFADVVDASSGEKKYIENIGNILRESANSYGLAILNGELAILGNRVNTIANINGTMISLANKNNLPSKKSFFLNQGPYTVRAASFSHDGKPVWINSDGEGTKGEFEERLQTYENGLYNSLAMKLDDTIKLGAKAMVVSDVIQTKGNIPFNNLINLANRLSGELGIEYILEQEFAENRIRGFNSNVPSFNISGSAVSIIDEEKLKHPPLPKAGDILVAISGHPNPRSNGITDKRKTMIKLFGEDYHNSEIGNTFLQYLAAPSIVFYPHFKYMLDHNLATSVYHMSGGAYNGKLARPFAKHGLYVSINNLFSPDWRELALSGASFTTARNAYSKWPMGNDAFVTTNNYEATISYLEGQGLKGRVVGLLEKAVNDKTGVELTAFNGERIYYSGR